MTENDTKSGAGIVVHPASLPNLSVTSEGSGCAPAKRAWIYPALCCAAVLLCILLSNPFNDNGFIDDWSYGHVAMKLAETGRMQYNGWGSPILLFQSFWAVPWIRLFGFSVQVLQVAMIPLSLSFVLLVYMTGRRLGLSTEMAAFASLATGTSPLFLPSAASWMTESCGCLFSMLCVYAALRCVQALESGSAVGWLWVLALGGLIGGANRQIVWAAPIMLIPYLCWVRRTDPAFRLHACAAYGGSGIAILTIIHYFGQPYGPLQLSHKEIANLVVHHSGDATLLLACLFLTLVLASLPAYFCFLSVAPRRTFPWQIMLLVALAIVTIGQIIATGLAAPYGNNILTLVGIVSQGQDTFGKPPVLTGWIRFVVSAAVNLCSLVSVAWFVRNLQKSHRPQPDPALPLFGWFSLGYMALILPGALVGFAYDRYMLPLLPLLILTVLLQFTRCRSRVPAVAWCCLTAFSFYAVTTTHDYFAGERARAAAATRMMQTGVPRDRISAGFEYDGWTQVERSPNVRVAQYQDRFMDDHGKGFWFEFWNHTPDFHPDFVVLNCNSTPSPHQGELRVDFRAWLPPFQRSVVVWKRSDLTQILQTARLVSVAALGATSRASVGQHAEVFSVRSSK